MINKIFKLLSLCTLMMWLLIPTCAQTPSQSYRAKTLRKFVYPERVHEVVGEVHNARNILKNDDKSVKLIYPKDGDKPYVIVDIGPASVGGYPVFKVTGKTGIPELRIAYACWYPHLIHPEFGEQGDYYRRYEDTYLGFDLPVIPGNPGRYELYTISREGEYMHPLIQGQERWVRIQLETEGTSVELDYFYIQNVHDISPLDGDFQCNDDDFNRLWHASVYTAQFASIDNSNPLDIVNGWCAARKLSHSNDVILTNEGTAWKDYSFEMDLEIRKNPLHTSGAGWAFRATDDNNCYTALIDLEEGITLSKREKGKSIALIQKNLPFKLTDGKIYKVKTILNRDEISIKINGQIVLKTRDKTFRKGKVGFYQPIEHWALFDNLKVTTNEGATLFKDDFQTDLNKWQFYRARPFIADGSLRDRMPWMGDLDWAGYNVYYGFEDARFMKGSLEMFADKQTPEGYVWQTLFPEDTLAPAAGDYGYWPSDEYSAWFVPTLANYLLYTGDTPTIRRLYPTAKKDIDYLLSYLDNDGLFNQREETRRGQGVGGDFGGYTSKKFAYMNILLYYALKSGAYMAEELKKSDDAAYYYQQAKKLKNAIFDNFWDNENGFFILSPTERKFHYRSNGLALMLGMVSKEQASTVIPALNENLSYSWGATKDIVNANTEDVGGVLLEKFGFQSGKFLSHSISGRFLYGADSAAVSSIRKSTWIKIMHDWRGVQDATWESTIYPPFRPSGEGYRDMSHADNACAQLFSGYILGVKPTQTGYREFEVIPHPSGLKWAKGKVPTPKGDIVFQWELPENGDALYMSTATVPPGTSCIMGVPISYFRNLSSIKLNDQILWRDGQILNNSLHIIRDEGNYLLIQGLKPGTYSLDVR